MAKADNQKECYQSISNSDAGWTHLNMEARLVKKGGFMVGVYRKQ